MGLSIGCSSILCIGGRAMEIVYNEDELKRYLREAVQASNEAPVLLDRFLMMQLKWT